MGETDFEKGIAEGYADAMDFVRANVLRSGTDLVETLKGLDIENDPDAALGAVAATIDILKNLAHNLTIERTEPPLIGVGFLERMAEFSDRAFGPGKRTAGLIQHICKELDEIELDPTGPGEWVDVLLLAFDGARRHGATSEETIGALWTKLRINEQRSWPDWRTAPEGTAIEHDRSTEA